MSDLDRDGPTSPRWWSRLEARIERRVRSIPAPVRGVLVAADATAAWLRSTIALRALEVVTNIEWAQDFGFASAPTPGVEVIAVPVGGRASHLVIVGGIDRTFRPDLVAGEAALYNAYGVVVKATAAGGLKVDTASGTTLHILGSGVVTIGGSGPPVARLGDTVAITGTTAGGEAVTGTGTITSGSSKVYAG